MRKKRLENMKEWLLIHIGDDFSEVITDDGTSLVSSDIIINELDCDKPSIMFKSDLYPDDVAIDTLILTDFAKKFRYKGILVGELFTFDIEEKEMYWGREAIEKFQETQYEVVEEDVKYNLQLDYMLAREEGHPC